MTPRVQAAGSFTAPVVLVVGAALATLAITGPAGHPTAAAPAAEPTVTVTARVSGPSPRPAVTTLTPHAAPVAEHRPAPAASVPPAASSPPERRQTHPAPAPSGCDPREVALGPVHAAACLTIGGR